MTFGLSAAAIGGIAAGAGAIGGAMISGNAAENAAATQAGAAGAATAEQKREYDKQLQLQEPWRQGGMSSLNALLQYMGLPQQAGAAAGGQQLQQTPGGGDNWNEQAYLAANPDVAAEVAAGKLSSGLQHYQQWGQAEGRPGSFITAAAPAQTIPAGAAGSLLKPFSAADFQADPGYAFVQQQGEQGLARAAQAGRGVGSGKYLKDAMRFNTGLGSQEYSKVYDRYRSNQGDIFNRLASVAGIGQTATNQQTAASGAYGQQVGSNIIGAGNATAAGQVAGANALNGAIGQGISLYQQQNLLNRVYPSGGYGGGVTPPNPYYGQTTVPAMDWYS